MILKIRLCLLLTGILLFPIFNFSQNLVLNSGFEDVNCTSSVSNWPIEYCDDWFNVSYTLSTDIFHSCISDPVFHPPNMLAGHGYPYKGEGMAGFIPLMVKTQTEPDPREIMSVKLMDTLSKDSAYCISFWVKNARTEDYEFGIDNIGIKFTEDTIEQHHLYETPDIKSPDNDLMNENEWIQIIGYYIAKGGESYLNLGTFGSREDINWFFDGPDYFSNGLSSFLYYFVDDVRVSQCNKDSLLTVNLEIPNVFTPNGDGVNDLFELNIQNIQTLEIQVVNRWGETILTYDALSHVWDGKGLSAGVYFIIAKGQDKFGNPISETKTVSLLK